MKIMDIVQKIAFVMMFIGIAGMDSDKLIIPMILALSGAIALFITSTMEHESGKEEE